MQKGADTGTPSLAWPHLNPVTGDARETNPSGIATAETHVDPEGVNVGNSDPFAGTAGDPSEGGMSQSAIDSMVAALMPGYGGQKEKGAQHQRSCRGGRRPKRQ